MLQNAYLPPQGASARLVGTTNNQQQQQQQIRNIVRFFSRISGGPGRGPKAGGAKGLGFSKIGKINKFCNFWRARSRLYQNEIFARKYAFCRIFQNLPDSQAEIFEIWQNLATFANFFPEISLKLLIFQTDFLLKF